MSVTLVDQPVVGVSIRVSAGSAHTPDYRLTRRGRLVVFLLGLLVVAVAGVVFAAGSVATAENERTESVVVLPGETLWSIASETAGDGDVRDMMSHLVELNDLDGVSLDAGQRLTVPVS